eukprot:240725_1
MIIQISRSGQLASERRMMSSVALTYHEKTKHGLKGYAPGPGRLDWKNQPNPFRWFEEVPEIHLQIPPPSSLGKSPRYSDLFQTDAVKPHPVSRGSVSSMLYHSLALSATKRAGESEWHLRVNPSSGNLHPTEFYLIIPDEQVSESDSAGTDPASVFHYYSKEHCLQRRGKFSKNLWDTLTNDLVDGSFLFGFSSIFWREAWKYGSRAFRYCNHDVGHAIAALQISCRMHGWRAFVLNERLVSTRLAAGLMGVDRSSEFCA